MEPEQSAFKPVYILGAGASAALGTPLMNNFLSEARALQYSGKIPAEIAQMFDEVFTYQGSLYETRKYLGLDLDNIETLFSILDMHLQTETSLGEDSAPTNSETGRLQKIRDSFISLVLETIAQTTNYSHPNYQKVISCLARPIGSSFITFNYDQAIEKAIAYSAQSSSERNYFIDYGASDKDEKNPDWIYVLKLHGSVNWTYCSKCGSFKNLEKHVLPCHLVSNNHQLHDLGKCREIDSFTNVIVPPTWYKYNYLPIITKVWNHSIRQISLATHLFIIGYSFPRTDVFFDQLLTLGLRHSRNLKKVIVINSSPTIRNVLEGFFDKHFLTRHVHFFPCKLEDLDGCFTDPIKNEKGMEDTIRVIDREARRRYSSQFTS